jgi:hypothetical protein
MIGRFMGKELGARRTERRLAGLGAKRIDSKLG